MPCDEEREWEAEARALGFERVNGWSDGWWIMTGYDADEAPVFETAEEAVRAWK